MSWWTKLVEWFGVDTVCETSIPDGRLLRIKAKRIGSKFVIMDTNVLCSNCGKWITSSDDSVTIKDGLGSTRNHHKVCPITV